MTRQDEFCRKGLSNGDVLYNLDDELLENQSSLCCGLFIVQCTNGVKLYLHFLIILCYAKKIYVNILLPNQPLSSIPLLEREKKK